MTANPGADEPRRLPVFSLAGAVGASIGYLLALTPSLVPRPPVFLGLVAGVTAAIAYGMCAGASHVLHLAGVPRLSDRARRAAVLAIAVFGGLALVAGIQAGVAWQNEIRTALGVPEEPGGRAVAGAVAVGSLLGLLVIGRFLRRLTRRVITALEAHWPRPWAVAVGVALIVGVVSLAVGGRLVRASINVADFVYAGKNEGSADGVVQPTSSMRSGGPGSLMAWDSLGREGRAFIASGPSGTDITALTSRPAIDPIRIYAGLDSAPTPEERAALVVAELQRTHAFDRAVLLVAGVAGTGWMEQQSIDPLEYLWGGDTAIAASQYSYLPSWISFLVDQERAQAEGRALVQAVEAAWSQLPADDRPRLIAYGLSLGSFSIQSAFDSEADLARRTDGAVLAGTPSFSEPWQSISADRDPGSPQWQPVIDGGDTVRFADDADDFAVLGRWEAPRIAYLQHADDPVVWWSFDLLLQRPDWLAEPPGPAVSQRMRWMPIITFLQVTVDQFFGVNQPNGFGHNYSLHMAQTWADVVGVPDGWTQSDTALVQRHLTG